MLQLSNIKASRVNNRVNLIFSDNSYLPFFIDDIFKLSLKKGQDIDPDKHREIKETSLLYLGKEYALNQIALSPKSEKKLILKLKLFFHKKHQKYNLDKSLTDSIINQIISYIKSKSLLDETSFVSFFINKNRQKSQSQILFLLTHEGITITPQIKELLKDQDDIPLIEKFLEKKKINASLLADFNFKQKIIASLFRRGFTLSDIHSVIDARLKLK